MEAQDHWEGSTGGEISNSDVNFQDTNDRNEDEDLYYTSASGSPSKLQFRRDVSRARWNQEMRMAEVLERKSKMWITTGIVRGGQTYCFLEETLFLAEIGAVHLLGDNDTCLTLKDIYEKVSEGKSGCCYELFQVYRQLKSLGYVVGRHGVAWTIKSCKSASESHSLKEKDSIFELFSNLLVNDNLRPAFDVYHPNSSFRKPSPGNPCFMLCLASDTPPLEAETQVLEKQFNGVPLKICHAEHGRVSFFSFDKAVSKLLQHGLDQIERRVVVFIGSLMGRFGSSLYGDCLKQKTEDQGIKAKQSKQKLIRVLIDTDKGKCFGQR